MSSRNTSSRSPERQSHATHLSARRDDQVDVQRDELGCAHGEPLGLALGIAVVDHDVPTFNVAEVTEPLPEGLAPRSILGEAQDEIADPPRLLRPCGERRAQRTSQGRQNEFAAIHYSIT